MQRFNIYIPHRVTTAASLGTNGLSSQLLHHWFYSLHCTSYPCNPFYFFYVLLLILLQVSPIPHPTPTRPSPHSRLCPWAMHRCPLVFMSGFACKVFASKICFTFFALKTATSICSSVHEVQSNHDESFSQILSKRNETTLHEGNLILLGPRNINVP